MPARAAQTLSHFGAIAATGWLLHQTWGTALAVPVFVVRGMLLNYLFAAQHEFNHRTVFATRWLNDACSRITGLLVIYPRDQERWFHFEHHRHTQDWRRDPELLGRRPFTLGSYLLYLTGLSYWWFRLRKIASHARGQVADSWLTPAQRLPVVREARGHLAVYAALGAVSLWQGSWLAVQLWLAPLLVTKITHQVQNITEHTGISHARDTVRNTRTIRTWAVLRRMAWNMQFHTAHHTFPGVPFHRLPELHEELVARLGFEPPSTGYLAFQRQILHALRRGPEPVSGLEAMRAPGARANTFPPRHAAHARRGVRP